MELKICSLMMIAMVSKFITILSYILLVFLLAHNALLQVVYENNTEKSPVAAMWRYRSLITIEHLEFFIEQQKSTVKCPILKQYLKEVMINIIRM